MQSNNVVPGSCLKLSAVTKPLAVVWGLRGSTLKGCSSRTGDVKLVKLADGMTTSALSVCLCNASPTQIGWVSLPPGIDRGGGGALVTVLSFSSVNLCAAAKKGEADDLAFCACVVASSKRREDKSTLASSSCKSTASREPESLCCCS